MSWDLPMFKHGVLTYEHPHLTLPATVEKITGTDHAGKQYKIKPTAKLVDIMLDARNKNVMTCRALSVPVLTYGFQKGFMVASVEIKQLDFTLKDAVYERRPFDPKAAFVKQETEAVPAKDDGAGPAALKRERA